MVTCTKHKRNFSVGLLLAAMASFSLPASAERGCAIAHGCNTLPASQIMTVRSAVDTSATSLSPVQRLDLSAALLAAGQESEAVEARNTAISDWLDSLAAQNVTQIDIRKSRGGVILAVNYSQKGSGQPVHALWLAVPDGPGLPAAAVLRPDPMRASMRAARTGRTSAALTILEHRTCQDARILRETLQPAAVASFDRLASNAMRAYLIDQENSAATASGEQPTTACRMPELMLPGSQPLTQASF